MKARLVILLVVIISLALMGTAFAVPKGKTLEFPGGKEGKVIFDGTKHAEKELKCKDCHEKIFMSIVDAKKVVGPPELKMDDISAGKYCGTCHNGDKAFSAAKDKKENCVKCHKK